MSHTQDKWSAQAVTLMRFEQIDRVEFALVVWIAGAFRAARRKPDDLPAVVGHENELLM